MHRATLTEAYGGREVAVKVQRPAIEPKLLGDVANLKNIARYFRNVEAIPVDYYVVLTLTLTLTLSLTLTLTLTLPLPLTQPQPGRPPASSHLASVRAFTVGVGEGVGAGSAG